DLLHRAGWRLPRITDIRSRSRNCARCRAHSTTRGTAGYRTPIRARRRSRSNHPATTVTWRDTEPMSAWAELHLRRVGFRGGTDRELMALHSIEAPIEMERGSNRMPQALDAYIAFARKLPSQFDDHAWLVEGAEGDAVACGYCWSNSAGDPRVIECDVLVRRDRRRQSIGSRLLAAICDETVKEGRSLLTWSTFDAVTAGESFSRRLGARVARVNRTSELPLADVDWATIERWARA